MRFLRYSIFTFLFLFFLITLFQSKLHRLKSTSDLPPSLQNELVLLGAKALKSDDVPVGALLVYKGEVIGKGFNTVLRDSSSAGHAEVNALDMAMKRFGPKKFQLLDRANLYLYSTFEPCEMCMGTMQHYNIMKISYMKEKPFSSMLKQQLKTFYYQLRKQKSNGAALQDSLFHLHPEYPLK